MLNTTLSFILHILRFCTCRCPELSWRLPTPPTLFWHRTEPPRRPGCLQPTPDRKKHEMKWNTEAEWLKITQVFTVISCCASVCICVSPGRVGPARWRRAPAGCREGSVTAGGDSEAEPAAAGGCGRSDPERLQYLQKKQNKNKQTDNRVRTEEDSLKCKFKISKNKEAV